MIFFENLEILWRITYYFSHKKYIYRDKKNTILLACNFVNRLNRENTRHLLCISLIHSISQQL